MIRISMLDLRREYEYMKADIDAAIKRCLDHQQWILGPEVAQLEGEVAQYLKAKHCVGVSSGTDALVLALRALAIKLKQKEYFDRTDKIITTPFTFTATGDAILRAGAIPVFVDIDPNTFNIDPQAIEKYLETKPMGVVGIIPVHLYGQACGMDEIMAIAKEYNLFVVEDVAQAFGGSYKGKKLGTIGDIGTYSFFPSKNLGGFGDGGMTATNDSGLAEIVRMLTKHGGKDKYNVDHIGYNARLDTLQAAILLAKLKFIDEFNQKRKDIAKEYNRLLVDTPGIVLPKITDHHVFHQYTIRVLNNHRDTLQNYLKAKNIDSMIYYPISLHKMKVFDGLFKKYGDLHEAEKTAGQVLSLPIEPLLQHDEMSIICAAIKKDL